jgi:hypothetical protein
LSPHLANGLFFMGVLAALMVPLLALLLVVEIIRGRQGGS